MAGVPEHLARTILDLVKRYLRDEYKIDLSRQVRGTLPIDYGGTGSSSGAMGPPGPTGPPGPAGPPGLAGPLDTLTDVTIASPIAGQVLRKSGGDWVNAQLAFADVGTTPTTLAGYGITDASSKTASDARYAPLAHTQGWGTITGTPATLAGYGITDAVTLGTAQTIAGVKTFTAAPILPMTPGSVLFAGAGGVVAQDPGQLVWDAANDRLGIGTATPQQQLHLVSNVGAVLSFDAYGSASPQRLQFRRGFGTAAAPLPVTTAGLTIAGYQAYAYGSTGFQLCGVVSFSTDTAPVGDDLPTRWSVFVHRAGDAAGSTVEAIRVVNSGWTGLGTNAPTARLHVRENDQAVTTVSPLLTLSHVSTGVPDVGFGSALAFTLKSSTTAAQPAADLTVTWATATHASRKSRLSLTVYDTLPREAIRMEGSGSEPMIGFLGAPAALRQILPAAATDPATTMALANAIRAALITFGLGGYHDQ